jgi:hypothetical protein
LSVRFFYSRQIGAGQFGTFSTASVIFRKKTMSGWSPLCFDKQARLLRRVR